MKTIKIERQTNPTYNEYGYIVGYDIESYELKCKDSEVDSKLREMADDESITKCSVE